MRNNTHYFCNNLVALLADFGRVRTAGEEFVVLKGGVCSVVVVVDDSSFLSSNSTIFDVFLYKGEGINSLIYSENCFSH